MLAIFSKNTATVPVPDNLHLENSVSAMEDESLVNYFAEEYPGSFKIDLKPQCIIRSSPDSRSPVIPRLFAVNDDIFCILLGRIENMDSLPSTSHNVNTAVGQPSIVIDAYKRTVRAGEQSQWLNMLQELKGKFSVVIFDNLTKRMFAAMDCDPTTGLPFYWGTDAFGNLMFTNNEKVIKKGCQGAYGLFPKGCYVMTSTGLREFKRTDEELEVEQKEDSSGNMTLAIREEVLQGDLNDDDAESSTRV